MCIRDRPDTSFKFQIVNRGDFRVSTNPAIQLLDYLLDKRYGKGLSLSLDIDLEGFKSAGRDCDTGSDVTAIFASNTNVNAVGQKWQYPATGSPLWQGTVKSIESKTTAAGAPQKQVTFTDVIGKLANRWYDWKEYDDNAIVWHNEKAYIKSGGAGTMSEPTGNSASLSIKK